MSSATSVHTGDLLPHFAVTTIGGDTFDYSSIWQRRNLLLVMLPTGDIRASGAMVAAVHELKSELDALDTTAVMTRDRPLGLPAESVLIADRWGEIIHLAPIDNAAAATTASELREWLEYVANRCPECEGESK
jgi:hypothetical protein